MSKLNGSGLSLRRWLNAAGWGSFTYLAIWDRDNGDTFNQLLSAWLNEQDPAEWVATAPRRIDQR